MRFSRISRTRQAGCFAEVKIPFASVLMAPLVALRDLKGLLPTFVVGLWPATALGMFPAPPALNLYGSEARSTKLQFRLVADPEKGSQFKQDVSPCLSPYVGDFLCILNFLIFFLFLPLSSAMRGNTRTPAEKEFRLCVVR